MKLRVATGKSKAADVRNAVIRQLTRLKAHGAARLFGI